MHKYKDIEYRLQRSNRKTASIYIERDGSVSLLVPDTLDDSRVDELIESKRRWIYEGIAEWEDLNATRVHREFVSGEGFLYLGRSYRLQIVEAQDEPLKLIDGCFRLRLNSNDNDPAAAFRGFYRSKGREKIRERVAVYEPSLGVKASSIRVQELQNRWGSCGDDGSLAFHWKCMMAPLTVLDYIVVHELAHILHHNHSKEFWSAVDRVMPDYSDRREWLRVNGAGMDL